MSGLSSGRTTTFIGSAQQGMGEGAQFPIAEVAGGKQHSPATPFRFLVVLETFVADPLAECCRDECVGNFAKTSKSRARDSNTPSTMSGRAPKPASLKIRDGHRAKAGRRPIEDVCAEAGEGGRRHRRARSGSRQG